jgi:hypothetical protein
MSQKEVRLALIRHRDGFDRPFPATEVAGHLFIIAIFVTIIFGTPALIRSRRRYY